MYWNMVFLTGELESVNVGVSGRQTDLGRGSGCGLNGRDVGDGRR